MAHKTPVEKMDTAIAKILAEYGDHIQRDLDLVTQKMGAKGATALRQQSRLNFTEHTGEYAKGWKYAFRKTQRSAGTTIYNEKYSLPHLLEHSHVVRNGTQRVVSEYRGRPHIEPVANDLVSTYEREVINKL